MKPLSLGFQASDAGIALWVIILFARAYRGGALVQTWDVTMGFRTPDCVDNAVMLVNGEFPGPSLTIKPGETVEILVRNHMPNQAIIVHFHGQNQVGTPYMDGVSMISSCPTGPHQSFRYVFTANEDPGTYMYHLHVGGMRHLGVYGMLVAEDRETDPLFTRNLSGDLALMLSDWYHASVNDIVTGLVSAKYRWPRDPQSILINGKGRFGCTAAQKAGQMVTLDGCDLCPAIESMEVLQGGKYRLRFANNAAFNKLNVAIEKHTMTVIEADGHPITPMDVPSLDLSSGQRYSVLVEADQAPGAYRISVAMHTFRGELKGHFALLKYAGANVTDPGAPTKQELAAWHPPFDDTEFSFWQQANFTSRRGARLEAPSDAEVTKRLVLTGTTERFQVGRQKNDGAPEDNCERADDATLRWGVNRVSFEPARDRAVAAAVFSGDTASFTRDRGYVALERGDVVDVVVQTSRGCASECVEHPWHLHGHHFWVLGQGRGSWAGTAEQEAALRPGSEAVLRDTVTLVPAPDSEARECGWVRVRFRADNPGAWLFHCHIEWDALMGMQTVFWYSDGSLPPPPDGLPCTASQPETRGSSDDREASAARAGSAPARLLLAVTAALLLGMSR